MGCTSSKPAEKDLVRRTTDTVTTAAGEAGTVAKGTVCAAGSSVKDTAGSEAAKEGLQSSLSASKEGLTTAAEDLKDLGKGATAAKDMASSAASMSKEGLLQASESMKDGPASGCNMAKDMASSGANVSKDALTRASESMKDEAASGGAAVADTTTVTKEHVSGNSGAAPAESLHKVEPPPLKPVLLVGVAPKQPAPGPK